MKSIRLYVICLLLASLFCLSACSPDSQEESTIPTENPMVTEFSTVVSGVEDLAALNIYPNLAKLDLRGSTCYDAILAYAAAHPQVEVIYDVILGDKNYDCGTETITLDADSFTFEELIEKIGYLPKVTSVSLPETNLPAELLASLSDAFPTITFEYTVAFSGQLIPGDTQFLDLSSVTPDQLDKAADLVAKLPQLTQVELMNAEGTSLLSLTNVAKLQDAQPSAFFHYTFDLYGKTVSTADEVVEYDEVYIGNEGEQTIRQALDILDNCTYFKLDDCGIDNEIMASIRTDYPDTKVVWRVRIPPYSMLTDETMLRLTHHLENDMIEDLKYLNDVTYLDVGHNLYLTDMSFVQYMPKLECVIIAGSNVVDVSYFKHCPNLIWLEMCFCYNIQDISFLENHPTLKYLNISFTSVSDISALENVKLDRFNCMGTNVDYEQQQAFIERNPDCISVWTGMQPFGYGWRYDDYGYTFFSYYANMRKIFRYDDESYWGNHKE